MNEIMDILKRLHPEYEYDTSDDFIEDGLLDSFDVISLVSEIEEVFNVQIKGVDILPENFSSAERIAEIIIKCGGIV